MSINIKSYVMFDTETTGLPSPGNNPRITELCLIAVTREEIKSKQRDQRVFNKLHLCINPCKQIHHRSAEITGLHNDSLPLQATFSKQADLIVSFLRNLPQPTCLLAHNGHGFDFPLLKAELTKCRKALSENVHCADTLQAFRTFDGLPPVPEHVLQRKMQQSSKGKLATSTVSHVNTSLDLCELEDSKNGCGASNNGKKLDERASAAEKRGLDCPATSEEGCVKLIKLGCPNLQQLQQQRHNEVTPIRKSSNEFVQKVEKDEPEIHKHTAEHVNNVRKRLFTSPKLSLKSGDSSNTPNKKWNKGEAITNSSSPNEIPQGLSSDDSDCVSSNDNDADVQGENSSSTQCYLGPDLSQNSNVELSRHCSMTDSDKDFLEVCKEIDMVLSDALPVGDGEYNKPNSDRCQCETMSGVKVKPEESKDTIQHQSEKSSVSLFEVDGDKNKLDAGHGNTQQNATMNNNLSVSVSESTHPSPPPDRMVRHGIINPKGKSPHSFQKTMTATPQMQSPAGRKSYGLGNLYMFYFGQKPDVVHTAEDDCKTLLKLINLNVDKFVSYCDQNAVLFSDIESMY